MKIATTLILVQLASAKLNERQARTRLENVLDQFKNGLDPTRHAIWRWSHSDFHEYNSPSIKSPEDFIEASDSVRRYVGAVVEELEKNLKRDDEDLKRVNQSMNSVAIYMRLEMVALVDAYTNFTQIDKCDRCGDRRFIDHACDTIEPQAVNFRKLFKCVEESKWIPASLKEEWYRCFAKVACACKDAIQIYAWKGVYLFGGIFAVKPVTVTTTSLTTTTASKSSTCPASTTTETTTVETSTHTIITLPVETVISTLPRETVTPSAETVTATRIVSVILSSFADPAGTSIGPEVSWNPDLLLSTTTVETTVTTSNECPAATSTVPPQTITSTITAPTETVIFTQQITITNNVTNIGGGGGGIGGQPVCPENSWEPSTMTIVSTIREMPPTESLAITTTAPAVTSVTTKEVTIRLNVTVSEGQAVGGVDVGPETTSWMPTVTTNTAPTEKLTTTITASAEVSTITQPAVMITITPSNTLADTIFNSRSTSEPASESVPPLASAPTSIITVTTTETAEAEVLTETTTEIRNVMRDGSPCIFTSTTLASVVPSATAPAASTTAESGASCQTSTVTVSPMLLDVSGFAVTVTTTSFVHEPLSTVTEGQRTTVTAWGNASTFTVTETLNGPDASSRETVTIPTQVVSVELITITANASIAAPHASTVTVTRPQSAFTCPTTSVTATQLLSHSCPGCPNSREFDLFS